MRDRIRYEELRPDQFALAMIPPNGQLIGRDDSAEREAKSVDLTLEPVLRLASYTYDLHEPVADICVTCGLSHCPPRTWSRQILDEAAEDPYLIISVPTQVERNRREEDTISRIRDQ